MTREPTDDRKRHGNAAAWTVGLIVLLLTAYVGGYFIGCREFAGGEFNIATYGIKYRIYKSPSVARLYVPAAWLEARVIRMQVNLQGGGQPGSVPFLFQASP